MTRLSLIRTSFLAAAVLLSACGLEGPQGPAGATGAQGDPGQQGDPGMAGTAGPPGPSVRTPAYCNKVTVTTSSALRSATAYCNSASDMPLSGNCFPPDGPPPGGPAISQSPSGWDSTTQNAGWYCSSSWEGTAYRLTAMICCTSPHP
jgi:hypothetical protein